MGYVHVEVIKSQSAKNNAAICGDIVEEERKKNSTTIILSDGLGSGVKANIYATMCASRLKELIAYGTSLRKSFASLVKTMNSAPKDDLPYSAFSVCRILNNGMATILSYDMPGAIFISGRFAYILPAKTIYVENSMIGELNATLKNGDALLLMSDGITAAGMGTYFTEGWNINDIKDFIQKKLNSGMKLADIPAAVKNKAAEYWNFHPRDDLSVILIRSRKGTVVNLLTGPPRNKTKDKFVVSKFLSLEGYKIICGGTTAQMVSRITDRQLIMDDEDYSSVLTPPKYNIKGIDLVTEGVVTLNQLYNLLDADPKKIPGNNPVSDLYFYMMAADSIHFLIGNAYNDASSDISLTQLGILTRNKIVPLLVDELRKKEKLVTFEYL
jgi:hypothetical protein